MSGFTFRLELRCPCGNETKTLTHSRVRSFDEMLPAGWRIVGDVAICPDCRLGRQSPATVSRPSAVAPSEVHP